MINFFLLGWAKFYRNQEFWKKSTFWTKNGLFSIVCLSYCYADSDVLLSVEQFRFAFACHRICVTWKVVQHAHCDILWEDQKKLTRPTLTLLSSRALYTLHLVRRIKYRLTHFDETFFANFVMKSWIEDVWENHRIENPHYAKIPIFVQKVDFDEKLLWISYI